MTPSNQVWVSPSSSTSAMEATWALNRDQVARWAGFLRRSTIEYPSSATATRAFSRAWPSSPMRSLTWAKISALTSPRMRVAISFRVVNPGSSSDASTRRSSAALIRSGG
ncbi:hypothetical protein PWG71_12115 [Nocardiopsis sp. N85]|uniref:hypothetical protein n=1 Tax=Nocardiopsis sp. N85 TaxID=3029400 RepID=UPI00237F50F4|nr:hypothetical protein [Nocardiopsis sp. N85]MDE3722136.1 hypothetical protein [Nocardiopsis sp. N85]